MRKLGQPAVILGLLLTMLVSATAAGDETVADSVTLRISNDDIDPVLVTIYDMNTDPPGVIVAQQTISGFAWISVSVTTGEAGTGHVRWTATSASAGPRRCGHHGDRDLGNDDFVQVFADSPCPGRR